MKRVFIDTNVILDHILQREHGTEAKKVVEWFVQNHVQMMMSVGGFYTMHYLIDKYLRQELLLVTFNIKHYPQTETRTRLSILTPQQFIETYISNSPRECT